MDATVSSVGSGPEDATFLRAQLHALQAKVKVLEANEAKARQSPRVSTAACSPTLVEDFDVGGVDELRGPSEGASDPAEQVQGLEDVDGVLTQSDYRSPSRSPPSGDVDREEGVLLVDIDASGDAEGEPEGLDGVDAADDASYLANEDSVSDVSLDPSDQEELGEAGDFPLGAFDPSSGGANVRSSTPRQTPEPSDSEDESVCSASDDGGAARLERLFGAARRENVTMPPPPPPCFEGSSRCRRFCRCCRCRRCRSRRCCYRRRK